jgi:cytoskeletal protein CcmA (bactofilin family)
MFNRQDENAGNGLNTSTAPVGEQPTTPVNGEPSVINAGLTIVGNLQSNTDVVISGTIEGDISSRGLTVSEGAKVTGTIECSTVQLRGQVNGQIKASAVKVARTGNLNGDIFYDTLSIDEGAVVEGQLRRRDKQPGKAQKASTVTPIGGDTSKKDSTEIKAS